MGGLHSLSSLPPEFCERKFLLRSWTELSPTHGFHNMKYKCAGRVPVVGERGDFLAKFPLYLLLNRCYRHRRTSRTIRNSIQCVTIKSPKILNPSWVFKGTFQPDWICMRVVPLDRPGKGHQPLYVLDFLFWSWIFEKTSKFWAASYKNASNPPTCWDHGLYICNL